MTNFFDAIKALCQKAALPKPIFDGFMAFTACYAEAAKNPSVSCFTHFIEEVAKQLKSPYQFLPVHKGIEAYYSLGLDFVRPLIDFSKSRIDQKEALQGIQEAVNRGENVILLANHQTEIDPQIISLLLVENYPALAKDMIFVAGHRVTTDPLAVPLSLGRNLICIYSKRHIEQPPEKKAEKLQHNQKALKGLEELLNEGGKCIYIAPSGGRDRVNDMGVVEVAEFDPQSVEMFYLLSQKAKKPTHIHTLALKTYDLLPPPDQVLKDIGEERKTRYSPAFLAFSGPIDMENIDGCAQLADKKERRKARADALFKQVVTAYNRF